MLVSARVYLPSAPSPCCAVMRCAVQVCPSCMVTCSLSARRCWVVGQQQRQRQRPAKGGCSRHTRLVWQGFICVSLYTCSSSSIHPGCLGRQRRFAAAVAAATNKEPPNCGQTPFACASQRSQSHSSSSSSRRACARSSSSSSSIRAAAVHWQL